MGDSKGNTLLESALEWNHWKPAHISAHPVWYLFAGNDIKSGYLDIFKIVAYSKPISDTVNLVIAATWVTLTLVIAATCYEGPLLRQYKGGDNKQVLLYNKQNINQVLITRNFWISGDNFDYSINIPFPSLPCTFHTNENELTTDRHL